MSSYDTLETGREGSRPIEIYSFALGDETFRYTSAEDDITFDGDEYEAIAISRGEIAQGADEVKRTMPIVVPGSNEFAERYIDVVPGQRATVSIIRLQRDETPVFDTSILIFKGGIHSVQFPDDGSTATIVARSIQAASSRTIPRFTYMGMCNHILYDNGCKVNPAGFSFTGAVTAMVGNVVTVSGASGEADGFYTGGFCKPTTESDFRLILAHIGDELTLLLPFTTNLSGASLQVFAGCNHTFAHCGAKFDQIPEYGGFGFVPTKNPFSSSLI